MAIVAASGLGALWLHSLCGLGLVAAFWIAHEFFSVNLISDPDATLLVLWMVECPIVILHYGVYRQNPAKCSYLKAVGRGLLGLPAGMLLIALGAITLGAPVSLKYLPRTLHWSLLMSLFTFAPAATVYGSSWGDWQRIFAKTRPAGPVDDLVCFPAHGAILGSWFGAWPMPLDWERPWQEWPISVTYGALVGYATGMVVSFLFVLLSRRQQHIKEA